jgi:hypothetical protein
MIWANFLSRKNRPKNYRKRPSKLKVLVFRDVRRKKYTKNQFKNQHEIFLSTKTLQNSFKVTFITKIWSLLCTWKYLGRDFGRFFKAIGRFFHKTIWSHWAFVTSEQKKITKTINFTYFSSSIQPPLPSPGNANNWHHEITPTMADGQDVDKCSYILNCTVYSTICTLACVN